jgi:regulator of sirC expression with transglutaminase-like and TPR domain
MFHNEVSALITLMEDPDEDIYRQVRNELRNYGEDILPHLETYWEMKSDDPIIHDRMQELISSIHYEGTYNRLRRWLESSEPCLLELSLLVNRYYNPTADEQDLKQKVQRIRQHIWLELNDNLTALEEIHVFNHVFFTLGGFQAQQETGSNPRNIYLQDVLASRIGTGLSIGLLYAYLAESLDMPVQIVNLPGTCMLSYSGFRPEDIFEVAPSEIREQALFFIQPDWNGEVIQRCDIDQYLLNHAIPGQELFFEPSSKVNLAGRLIGQLIHLYIGLGNMDRVRELKTLQSLILERGQ